MVSWNTTRAPSFSQTVKPIASPEAAQSRPAIERARPEAPPPRSGSAWTRGWGRSTLASLAAKAQRFVHVVCRTAPAVAAVTLALTFGAGASEHQTAGAPLQSPVAVEQSVEVAPAVVATSRTYIVKRGDNLTKIADRLGTTVPAILELNDIRYANLIHPNQVLQIPPEISEDAVLALQAAPGSQISHANAASPRVDAPASYTVRPGDNLGRISRRVGVAVDALVALNDIRNPSLIQPGQVLQLRESDPDADAVAPAEPVVNATPTVDPHPPATQTVAPAPTVNPHPPIVRADTGISHLSAAQQKIVVETQPRLHWGMDGPVVTVLQTQLQHLGYPLGTADGDFGGMTRSAVRAFQAFNGLEPDGRVGPGTWEALASPDAVRLPSDGAYAVRSVYRPYSAHAYRLFLRAAADEGLPARWAIADSLHKLLDNESDGEVGRPNYTYGRRANRAASWPEIHAELARGRITAKSSATGLGQLLLSNVERHYPSGRAGINVPLEEAAGMLSYIQERHGTPDTAWRNYNSVHEGY